MADITLGQKVYSIGPLPLRQASKMRQKIDSEITGISTLIESLQGLNTQDVASLDPKKIGSILQVASSTILDLPEKLFDLICEYSPSVQSDREELLDTAYDDQVFVAFVEVLKNLIPLAQISAMLSGLETLGTSSSLASSTGSNR